MRGSALRLIGLVQLVRPHVATQAATYTFLGAYLSAGAGFIRIPATAIAALIVALVVAFGFVINDYADTDLDRLTKAERPIPSGAVARPHAMVVALALAGLTCALLPFVQPALQIIAATNLILSAAYGLVLKRTVLIGNAVVAALNSSILIFGGLAAGGLSPAIWSVVGMSFLYTLAQEVLYTVNDIEGDTQLGIITTAAYFGVNLSLGLFRGLMVLALGCALAPLWLSGASPAYLAALLVCVALPVGFGIIPLTWRYEPQAIGRACARVRAVRLAALAPLALLGTP